MSSIDSSVVTPSSHANAATLAAALIRNVDHVALAREPRAPLYDSASGAVSAGTAAQKLGAGYDVLAPGKRSCPYHYHLAQEEMFVILEGQGSLRVAGEMLPVRAGDVVFIPPGPAYPHQFINTSDAPMKYLSISTQERPEICYYPDSDKLGAFADGHSLRQRRGDALDYWDGEP
ncbi:MAG TPA: cupin domain-containing protein [Kofleriaceae bacterium]|nr:cupin domain-containing protein [Kofleriaceae bacterium]